MLAKKLQSCAGAKRDPSFLRPFGRSYETEQQAEIEALKVSQM